MGAAYLMDHCGLVMSPVTGDFAPLWVREIGRGNDYLINACEVASRVADYILDLGRPRG
jgi:hypothetical protein